MSNNKGKPQPDGTLPDVVVNQIIEHTVGGFIIFYFNQETGEPEQVMSFDSPAHSLALQKHMRDWQDAIDEVNFNNSVDAINKGLSAQNGDDEDDGDDKE